MGFIDKNLYIDANVTKENLLKEYDRIHKIVYQRWKENSNSEQKLKTFVFFSFSGSSVVQREEPFVALTKDSFYQINRMVSFLSSLGAQVISINNYDRLKITK